MKKHKQIMVLALAFIAAYLFTGVYMGLNALLFSLVSVAAARFLFREVPTLRFVLISLPILLSGLFIALYPQPLTKVYWCFSFGFMWTALAVDLRPLLIPFQALLSIIQSPFTTLFQNKDKSAETTTANQGSNKSITKALAVIMSALIIGLFVMLYASANPVLQEYFMVIDWDFINMQTLVRAFWYSVLFYGLLVIYPNKALARRNASPLQLDPEKYTNMETGEYQTGMISLWALSGILFLMNIMDVVLLSGGALPSGISYSSFLHQGFYILLASIALAILLILFFFRGTLNFHPQKGRVQLAAKVWLAQNALLGLVTAWKLFLYVGAYGLTYNRIWVLLCLLCVGVGLYLSLLKIKHSQHNWRFFNQMGLTAYIAGLLFSLLPYDLIISRYNLSYMEQVDYHYLINLDQPDLYYMLEKSQEDAQYNYQYMQSNIEDRIEYMGRIYGGGSWRQWNLYSSSLRNVTEEVTSQGPSPF